MKRAVERVAEQLTAERKRQEELEAKIGGPRFEMDTRTIEMEAKCSDLQINLQGCVQELEAAKEKMVKMVSAEEKDALGNFI